MKFKKIIVISSILLTLTNCAEQGGPLDKQGAGTLIGAVGGALVGSTIGGGHGNIAAIAIGTLAGAALGNSIGASLDNADKERMTRTTQSSLETVRTGQTVQWRNPDSGNSGTVTPTSTFQTNDGRYCREYTQSINVGGKVQNAYGKACRQPDGSWQISE